LSARAGYKSLPPNVALGWATADSNAPKSPMPGAPIDASTDAQERLILDLAGNRLDRSELADGEDNAMRRGQNGDKNDKGASGGNR